MKIITKLSTLLLLVVTAGCQNDTVAAVSAEGASPGSVATAAKTEAATFDIEGMTCASCNLTVKVAAEKVDGVVAAKASFDTKQAVVDFDPSKTSAAAIADAITKSGYTASPAKSVPN